MMTFKKGQTVYSEYYGYGVVLETDNTEIANFPVMVNWEVETDGETIGWYTNDGDFFDGTGYDLAYQSTKLPEKDIHPKNKGK